MSTYTAITNAEVAIGARIDTALMTALRDNAIAVGENDGTVPSLARTALPLFLDQSVSGVASDAITGLDLTSFTRLMIAIEGVSPAAGWGSYSISLNGVILVAGIVNTTIYSSNMLIPLKNGHCVRFRDTNVFAIATTIVNATTAITLSISPGTFDAGTWSAWALK
jgi:hypothetical protein